MKPTRTIYLVVRRELRDRLRNGVLWGATVVLSLGVVALVVLPTLLGDDAPPSYEVALIEGETDHLGAALTEVGPVLDIEVTTTVVDEEDAAVGMVSSDEVDAALVGGPQLVTEDGSASPELENTVTQAVAQQAVLDGLADEGVPPTTARGILGQDTSVPVVDPTGEPAGGDTGLILAFVLIMVLMFAIQFNAVMVLSGTVEEKSNHVVEVLLGTLRPWHLLTGKLVALGVLALGQVAIIATAGLSANALVGAVDLPEIGLGAIAVAVLMLVIGYAFYAALFAVAGSKAGSVEEASSTQGPLLLALFASIVLVFLVVLPNPTGAVAVVMSLLPPSAPFTLPARAALEALPAWQLISGIVMTVLGTVVAVRLAGRMYAATILAGGSAGWREALNAEPVR